MHLLGERVATVDAGMHPGVLRVQLLVTVQVQRDVEAPASLVALKRLLFGAYAHVPLDIVGLVASLSHVARELPSSLVDPLTRHDAGRFLLPEHFSGCSNALRSSPQGSCLISSAWVFHVWVLVVHSPGMPWTLFSVLL